MSGSITPGLSLLGDPMGLADYAATAQMDPVHKQLQDVGIPTTPTQPQQAPPSVPQPDPAVTGDAASADNPNGMGSPTATQTVPNAQPLLGAINSAQAAAARAQGVQNAPTIQAPPQQAPAPAPSGDQGDDWGGLFANQPKQAAEPQGDQWDLPAQQAPAKPVATLPATPSTGPDGAAVNSVSGNNYGNIRPPGASSGFNSYATPVDGVAAMSHQLSLYAAGSPATGGKPINTLIGLTSTWAPKGDGKNDPVAYAQAISKATGIPVDQPINLADPALQQKIIPAMARVEQGRDGTIDPGTLQQGIQLAASGKPIQMGQPLQSTAPGSDVTLAATSTQPAAQPDTSAAQRLALAQSMQGGGNDIASQLRAIGLNPSTMMGNPLLALGAGLAGKRTLGEGISAAAGNLNQLYMQRGDLGFKLAQMGLENKRLDNQMAYQNELLGVRDKQLGQGQQRIDNTAANQQAQRQQAQQRIDYTTSGGAMSFKDNLKESQEIDQEGEEAAKQLGTYANWQKLAQSGQAGIGAGVMAEMKRRLATNFPQLGIGPNTSDMQVADIMGKLWQQDSVQAMKGTGLRTQREFEVFQKSAPSLSTNPDAAAAAAGAMVNSANADLAAYKAWHDPNTNQADIMHQTNGVANFRSRFVQPAMEANAKGTVAVGPNGPSQQNIIKYDAQGNRVTQ